MISKAAVSNKCLHVLHDKITALQTTLYDLQYSAANETKSTAGDKHETALAMLQIEQENTGRQLQALLNQRLQLTQLNLSISAKTVVKGSLVNTNQGYVFIAVGMGKIQIDGTTIMVISPASPLGILLLGKQVGENIVCNNNTFHVLSFE